MVARRVNGCGAVTANGVHGFDVLRSADACDMGAPAHADLKQREALKARARDSSKATATLLVDASQAGTGECVAEPPAAGPRAPAAAPLTRGRTLSVKRAFSDATVLITGATGYLGSLVLEQLLRLVPDVKRIYVIVRSKRGVSGEERIDRLLARSMFHLHRENGAFRAEARAKVVVVAGDLLQPRCGLSAADEKRLTAEVDFVVHSAACIDFDEHIHALLAQNLQATKLVTELARAMTRLRGFVHVSTAYTNCDMPKRAVVHERVFPLLAASGKPVDIDALAAELMALPPADAQAQALQLRRQLNIPNGYFLTKRMAELHMLREAAHLPVAIVRPSLVGCVGGLPQPGYFGNSAGPTAIALGFATGLATFTCHKEDSVFDIVPGDVVASNILASAAALTQSVADLGAPLVVHACTSITNPTSLRDWWVIGYEYWSAKPSPVRLCPSGYPNPDRRPKPVGLPERGWVFWLWVLMDHIKFWILSALLSLFGYTVYAQKLWTGWTSWRCYNKEALDFDIRFSAEGAKDLEARLAPEERPGLQLVWRAGENDWRPYIHAHFDQIRYFFLQQRQYRAKCLPLGES